MDLKKDNPLKENIYIKTTCFLFYLSFYFFIKFFFFNKNFFFVNKLLQETQTQLKQLNKQINSKNKSFSAKLYFIIRIKNIYLFAQKSATSSLLRFYVQSFYFFTFQLLESLKKSLFVCVYLSRRQNCRKHKRDTTKKTVLLFGILFCHSLLIIEVHLIFLLYVFQILLHRFCVLFPSSLTFLGFFFLVLNFHFEHLCLVASLMSIISTTNKQGINVERVMPMEVF